jgi:hypothetical protein
MDLELLLLIIMMLQLVVIGTVIILSLPQTIQSGLSSSRDIGIERYDYKEYDLDDENLSSLKQVA